MHVSRGVLLLIAAVAGLAVGRAHADDWDMCKDEKLTADASIAACTRAINSKRFKARDLSTLHYNRAISYRQQSQLDLAITDYGEAIKADPKYEKPYNNRGVLFKEQGELDKAIAD